MADLNKLVEKIKADAELKKQFAQAVKENKVAEFCKNLGVEVTKEDISAFIKAKKGEISDADLKKVSGGCSTSYTEVSCEVLVSVCTAGTACIASSIQYLTQLPTDDSWSSCLQG